MGNNEYHILFLINLYLIIEVIFFKIFNGKKFYDRAEFDVKKKLSDLRQNIEFGLCHTHDNFN